jgi:flagellar biosynthesis protein FliQ
MNEADALDIVQYAVWVVLVASSPAVVVGMAVGVQEITLTFVPKIVAILLTVALTGPFVGAQISSFSTVIFQRIESGF